MTLQQEYDRMFSRMSAPELMEFAAGQLAIVQRWRSGSPEAADAWSAAFAAAGASPSRETALRLADGISALASGIQCRVNPGYDSHATWRMALSH